MKSNVYIMESNVYIMESNDYIVESNVYFLRRKYISISSNIIIRTIDIVRNVLLPLFLVEKGDGEQLLLSLWIFLFRLHMDVNKYIMYCNEYIYNIYIYIMV